MRRNVTGMTKKFCPRCATLHDGKCSAAALARAEKMTAAPKEKTDGARQGNLPRGATERGAGKEAGVERAAAAESVGRQEKVRPDADAVTRETAPAVGPSLDELRAQIAAMEAEKAGRRAANRDRVRAHRAGLTIAEYRVRQSKGEAG